MIRLLIIGNRANQLLVDPAMRTKSTIAYREVSISMRAQSMPNPAAFLVDVEVREEADKGITH
jgi:hypothetical protein